jgi:hypothetical protein
MDARYRTLDTFAASKVKLCPRSRTHTKAANLGKAKAKRSVEQACGSLEDAGRSPQLRVRVAQDSDINCAKFCRFVQTSSGALGKPKLLIQAMSSSVAMINFNVYLECAAGLCYHDRTAHQQLCDATPAPQRVNHNIEDKGSTVVTLQASLSGVVITVQMKALEVQSAVDRLCSVSASGARCQGVVRRTLGTPRGWTPVWQAGSSKSAEPTMRLSGSLAARQRQAGFPPRRGRVRYCSDLVSCASK